jgi:nitronate monooxygenase
MLATALTERLGLRHPIVQAPMGGVAGPELAAAVSAAGALGMISAGSATSAQQLREDVEGARATGERFGIGTLAWRLAAEPELLDVALEARPLALSISVGDVAPYATRVRAAGVPLLVQVSSAEAARAAVAAGADFVVAQGTEAGGHTGAVATLPLIEAVLAAVDVPVLGAGGIASGRGLAAVLAMGGAGAWIGTRFYATREARGGDEKKRLIVDARETETVHTRVFDLAQRLPWPAEYPGRALRNEFTDRWHGRENEIERQSVDYVYAGEATGAIHDVPPAGELVERISAQADELLRRFV